MTDYRDKYEQSLIDRADLVLEIDRLKGIFVEVLETARRRALWPAEADKIKKELGL